MNSSNKPIMTIILVKCISNYDNILQKVLICIGWLPSTEKMYNAEGIFSELLPLGVKKNVRWSE